MTKFAPTAKEFRHLVQHPNNEPDFDLIHLIAPVPSDTHFGKPLTIENVIQFCRTEGRSETGVIRDLMALVAKAKEDTE